MRLFQKETWSYAILLIILFAIAAVAVSQVLAYLEYQTTADFKIVTIVMIALTLGFMLIAGAFGLWAIQFAGEAESRRRIGQLIGAMDYLNDGLLAVDKKARITSTNPTARAMLPPGLGSDGRLSDAFPCLSEQDIRLLLAGEHPNEFERELSDSDPLKTLRFRSQPSEGMNLILLSDVTSMHAERERARHRARLQLIGQFAKGVAHDFNNLLCGISGHASLISRVPAGSSEMSGSLTAIALGADKGIALAGHLLELSQPSVPPGSTELVAEHVNNAAESLRGSLPPGWEVRCIAQNNLPAVALTGVQIEQVVVNLGWLAADASPVPGVMRIALSKPGSDYLSSVGSKFAVVVLVTTASLDGTTDVVVRDANSAPGVIQSIIQTVVEDTAGKLEILTAADGTPIYRVALPPGTVFSDDADVEPQLSTELEAYIQEWSILLARHDGEYRKLDARLDELRINAERVDSIMSALARVENDENLDA
ncbi:hypothetical protein ACFLQU_04865, partial [Verrucomicrobiota bacterium]